MTVHAAILTLHNKAALIGPVLRQLGWQLSVVDSFDTDLLGSFSGERPRFMSPYECALRKAALAADLSGLNIGIGSEGSFSAGPYGLGTFNQELICCVNVAEGWVVCGRFYGPSMAQQWQINDIRHLQQALNTVAEGQLLIVQQHDVIYKQLNVTQAEQYAVSMLNRGGLTLSYDLRAHVCLERQKHIRLAAEDLLQRLQRCCPQCSTPGFWPDRAVPGLRCQACGTVTELTRLRQADCQRCNYSESFAVTEPFADPQYCPECNP